MHGNDTDFSHEEWNSIKRIRKLYSMVYFSFFGMIIISLINYKYFFPLVIPIDVGLFFLGLLCLRLISNIVGVTILHMLFFIYIVTPFLFGGILGLRDLFHLKNYPEYFLIYHYICFLCIALLGIGCGWIYESKLFKNKYHILIETGIVNEAKGRINIDEPLWKSAKKERKKNNTGIARYAPVFLSVPSVGFIPLYIFASTYYGLDRQELKWYFANIFALICSVLLMPFIGLTLRRIFYFVQWQLCHKLLLYTNWHDILLKQREMNIRRKNNGMSLLPNLASYYLPNKSYKKYL